MSARRKRTWRHLVSLHVFCFIVAGLAVGMTASAQTNERTKPAAAKTDDDKAGDDNKTQTTVTVKGKRSPNRIDRQVYDNNTPGNADGTAADVLAKTPGVTVAPDGEVTLRGNAVQILVNGKPSPLLSGDNRGIALRAMPSGMIASVEVMSSPGAQYSANGAGGIINIVTRTALPASASLTLSGQVKSEGGYMISAFGLYNKDRLSLNGNISLSRNRGKNRSTSSLIQGDGAGATLMATEANNLSRQDGDTIFATSTIDYSLTDKDTLSGQFAYSRIVSDNRQSGRTFILGGNGIAREQYDSDTRSTFSADTPSIGVTWMRAGRQTGDGLKVGARLSRSKSAMTSDMAMIYTLSNIPANTGRRETASHFAIDQSSGTFDVDYNRGVGDTQFAAGIQISYENATETMTVANPYAPDRETPVINPALSQDFTYRQILGAAYATWQVPVGERWTVLGGLRAESQDFRGSQPRTQQDSHARYTRLNSSLFATYVLSDTRRLRLNYARRQQRPSPHDLNPATTYSTQGLVVGAPRLKPQETDSFEAGYEYVRQVTSYSARAYYLHTYRVINPVSRFVADPLDTGRQVIETTRRNAGSSTQAGIQFSYNGRLSKTLQLNATGDIYSIRLRQPAMEAAPSGTAISGTIGLNYQPNDRNSVYISLNNQSKRLTGEGFVSGFTMTTVQYSRTLNARTQLTVTLNNPFRTTKMDFVRDTSTVYSRFSNSSQPPSVYVGLTRRLSAIR